MSIGSKILAAVKPTKQTEADGREKFPNRLSFILSAMGGAVGLGNVLRYPSVVFANNGLQWFIPYFIALFFLGIPVLLLELSLGQCYRAGVVTSYNNMNHRSRGVGLGVMLTGYMVVCYYVPILSFVMHYFRCSFQSPLPWKGRGDAFYMEDVVANTAAVKGSVDGMTVTEWSYYPDRGMVGETAGWTIFMWFCVWLCMVKGISMSGRAIYFTMGLPIVMIIVLLGRSASLDNAGRGVAYYFAEWHSDKLGSGQIWQAACGQIFFSIGVGFGYFTTYASYTSRFANTAQDTLIIALSNSFYEIIAGFVVFSIIGFLDMTPAEDGQSLSTFTVGFLTYPLALAEMSGANFFSVVWFLTIALVGLSSSVALIESLITVVLESPSCSRFPRWIVATTIIIISLLISLVYCTQFGFYFLDAVDTWINNITLLLIVWSEIVAMSTMYRIHDVLGQVGVVGYALYNTSYILAQVLGVAVGQAVGPEAGAGVGFGIFVVGVVISIFVSKTPTAPAPRFWGKNAMLSKLWWLSFYSGNQLRRDFNVIVGQGKNWNIPFVWAPILRFISAPILAIIASFAYPMFYADFRMDPLHVAGFTFAHLSLFSAAIGIIFPRAFDILVQPARRDDSKVNSQPHVLMPGLVARVEGLEGIEESGSHSPGHSPDYSYKQ